MKMSHLIAFIALSCIQPAIGSPASNLDRQLVKQFKIAIEPDLRRLLPSEAGADDVRRLGRIILNNLVNGCGGPEDVVSKGDGTWLVTTRVGRGAQKGPSLWFAHDLSTVTLVGVSQENSLVILLDWKNHAILSVKKGGTEILQKEE
jgi:hypothetical protein